MGVIAYLPYQTHGGRGHMLDLDAMLAYLLEHRPPKDPTKPLHVKIALDGGTMTSGKRIKQEQATMQILNDLTLAEVKSHTTAYQWLIYLGDEEYDELAEELADAKPIIERWIRDGKVTMLPNTFIPPVINVRMQVTANGKEYTIIPFLVCDMKCLVRILGLYDVFSPKSYWKCCWCNCCKSEIANFNIRSWPLRDIKKMSEVAKAGGDPAETCGIAV